jgi:hypothetical protein
MIKHQTNGHGWKFMFLGANMDAVKEAESIGISKDWSTNYAYTPQGVCDTFTTMSYTASALRSAAITDDFNVGTLYDTIANDNK